MGFARAEAIRGAYLLHDRFRRQCCEAESGETEDTVCVHEIGSTPIREYEFGSLEEYNRVMADAFVPLVVFSRQPTFRCRFRAAGHADVWCFDIAASDHVVQRTDAHIQASPTGEYYKVCVMLHGICTVLQDGREAVLRGGDLAVCDTTRPYTLVMSEGARTAVLMFPRALVTIPPSTASEVTATRFGGDHGVAPIVSAFLASLVDNLESFTGAAGHRLGQHVVDLVATMLFDGLELDEPAARRSPLMARVCEFIDERLHDPELSLGTIAAAHFVSTRHLQALFQRERTTVTAWIRERRLEMCRRDLGDPYLAGESVASIATKWGFVEPSHFSRAFKAQYGRSPRAFRDQLEAAA
ncbi:helix-turn-helix domain-containing protein [Pseudoclavibacter endophyticus]|nr:helix-turn-helix domain-containing protein [Pseudoclavibacter endophyticus]